MEPSELIKDEVKVARSGARAECTNRTYGLGVVITEWGVKFIFDNLPNHNSPPQTTDLRDGEMGWYKCPDGRCCVGYVAYIKYYWPSGEKVDWIDGKASAGKCFNRIGFGLTPARYINRADILSDAPAVEIVIDE